MTELQTPPFLHAFVREGLSLGAMSSIVGGYGGQARTTPVKQNNNRFMFGRAATHRLEVPAGAPGPTSVVAAATGHIIPVPCAGIFRIFIDGSATGLEQIRNQYNE